MRTRLAVIARWSVVITGSPRPRPRPARGKLLTLYSPKIHSLPYVHDTHESTSSADGRQAPDEPGYITGFAEQALVD